MKKEHALYQVALKVILKKESKILLLRDKNGNIDFPGGRIDNTEHHKSLETIIARKVKEEIGNAVYFLGPPAFQTQRNFENKGFTHLCYLLPSRLFIGRDYSVGRAQSISMDRSKD